MRKVSAVGALGCWDVAQQTVTVLSCACDAAGRSGRLRLRPTESRETISGEKQVVARLSHKYNICSWSELPPRPAQPTLDQVKAELLDSVGGGGKLLRAAQGYNPFLEKGFCGEPFLP